MGKRADRRKPRKETVAALEEADSLVFAMETGEHGASPDGDRAGAPSELSPQAVSSEAAHPLRKRPFWMTDREITHFEAKEIAKRFIASNFRNSDHEYPRISIPANPDRDDDLLLLAYIFQQEGER